MRKEQKFVNVKSLFWLVRLARPCEDEIRVFGLL